MVMIVPVVRVRVQGFELSFQDAVRPDAIARIALQCCAAPATKIAFFGMVHTTAPSIGNVWTGAW